MYSHQSGEKVVVAFLCLIGLRHLFLTLPTDLSFFFWDTPPNLVYVYLALIVITLFRVVNPQHPSCSLQ
jgi:hypothetical protein